MEALWELCGSSVGALWKFSGSSVSNEKCYDEVDFSMRNVFFIFGNFVVVSNCLENVATEENFRELQGTQGNSRELEGITHSAGKS